MKNKILKTKWLIGLSLPLAAVFPLSSCGLMADWDWKTSTNNNTQINYCLLIGQNEHTDSIERTRGTRKYLGTLDTSDETKRKTKDNPNLAKPIDGETEVTDDDGVIHKFTVKEIEQMEQKSITGAAWDPITANGTAGTWIAKHGHDITFFVSNNDAMAEGAMWASNWIKGMPIFGYDANSTTLQWINSGNITGTVDQNPSSQAAVAMLMFRNFLEDREKYWETFTPSIDNHWFGSDGKDGKPVYTPLWNGYHEITPEPKADDKYGYVNANLFTDNTLQVKERQVLCKCTAIAKLGEKYPQYNNISDYVKEDGSAKQPSDMFDQSTYIKREAIPEKHFNLCHTYSNKSEAFLVATMRPYYNEYARRMGLDLDPIEGDGTDETLVLNQISARPANFDGFFICMAKTTTALQYIQLCAKKAYEYEEKRIGSKKHRTWSDAGWDNWEDRLDSPLFFWIRHPTHDDGSSDTDSLNNKYFKYTYYIGANSANGGQAQGKLIKAAITKWYRESLKKE